MVCAGLVAASIPVALQTIVAPTPPGPRNQYINFNVHDTDAEVYFTLHIPLSYLAFPHFNRTDVAPVSPPSTQKQIEEIMIASLSTISYCSC